jgi:hypothetical protein
MNLSSSLCEKKQLTGTRVSVTWNRYQLAYKGENTLWNIISRNCNAETVDESETTIDPWPGTFGNGTAEDETRTHIDG